MVKEKRQQDSQAKAKAAAASGCIASCRPPPSGTGAGVKRAMLVTHLLFRRKGTGFGDGSLRGGKVERKAMAVRKRNAMMKGSDNNQLVMVIIVVLGLIGITLQGYRTYQRQAYWLDRQTTRLIRYIPSLFR